MIQRPEDGIIEVFPLRHVLERVFQGLVLPARGDRHIVRRLELVARLAGIPLVEFLALRRSEFAFRERVFRAFLYAYAVHLAAAAACFKGDVEFRSSDDGVHCFLLAVGIQDDLLFGIELAAFRLLDRERAADLQPFLCPDGKTLFRVRRHALDAVLKDQLGAIDQNTALSALCRHDGILALDREIIIIRVNAVGNAFRRNFGIADRQPVSLNGIISITFRDDPGVRDHGRGMGLSPVIIINVNAAILC